MSANLWLYSPARCDGDFCQKDCDHCEKGKEQDDLISRQAAIDALSLGKEMLSRVLDDMDVVGTDRDKYSWGLGLIESNIKDIEELPAAQPEPKRGRWIDGSVLTYSACSVCGYQERYAYGYNYCPHCGAKMEEWTA